MKKRAIAIILFGVTAGCSVPVSDATQEGARVTDVYVRDLNTGKCICISWGGAGDKITSLKLANELKCLGKNERSAR